MPTFTSNAITLTIRSAIAANVSQWRAANGSAASRCEAAGGAIAAAGEGTDPDAA
jgi:hypothetical protein